MARGGFEASSRPPLCCNKLLGGQDGPMSWLWHVPSLEVDSKIRQTFRLTGYRYTGSLSHTLGNKVVVIPASNRKIQPFIRVKTLLQYHPSYLIILHHTILFDMHASVLLKAPHHLMPEYLAPPSLSASLPFSLPPSLPRYATKRTTPFPSHYLSKRSKSPHAFAASVTLIPSCYACQI